MKLSSFETKLKQKIEEQLPGAAPGVLLQVYQGGKKICDISVGTSFPYYDLASLTKVIFSVQALIWAYQQGLWNFESKVRDILPWFPGEQTLVAELLNHSSGLPWWLPVYEKLHLQDPVEKRWTDLREILKSVSIEKTPQSVYSDVGFWVIGFILEELYQKSLLEVWTQIKSLFYSRLSLEFHPNNKPIHPIRLYAPTERCAWRRRVLQGEVHDENAWALGGVAPHAGLFGSIDDVGWFGLFLRGQLLGVSKTVIKQKTAKLFATRARPPGRGDWALGYMMPTPGSSSSGEFFSPYSIGHTGFTGTSFWYDPSQDLLVALLSNRLAFGREIKEFQLLRPKIHNWVIEGLRRGVS